MEMKVKFRADELIEILLGRRESVKLMKKYRLDQKKVGKIEQSLQKGKWEIIH